jgi:hypothetical protein
MQRPCLVLLAAPLLAVACTAEPLLLAPDHAVAGGVELQMSVGLFRDFQPNSPPDGKPLAVIIQLAAADSSLTVPSTVVADSAWVVNGQETWAAQLTEDIRWQGIARFAARDGPKWAPGTRVDVYVALRDGAHRQLLEAAQQPIVASF